ncbi:NADH kinase pos5, mitochondrial [Neolecta irregularis DAH-3]|uniref:NADH kinase pos5, mitochondrial n=1 Tax=Neolecta irregularis (strain DAH-3) TaxID=1198029 RepID=A0A1U7LN80_NEOID|nr:NADH kinase pos5, mitochondrial [Neolecta irregularis DAH-3]|eukprot:OLL24002.1 NADH kinase pos5, mitochondrial [Neolecta irregularis DAH-3]
MVVNANWKIGSFSRFLQRRTHSTIKDWPNLPNCSNPSYRQIPGQHLHRLQWPSPPRNILLVKKHHDERVRASVVEFARHVNQAYKDLNILLEPSVIDDFKNDLPFAFSPPPHSAVSEYNRIVDAVVTFGGDGTVLHASSLFSKCRMPPVLSFSLGTLGFLLPFTHHIRDFCDYKLVFDELVTGKVRLLERTRLQCAAFNVDGTKLSRGDFSIDITNVMNEVNLHRGREPHLTNLKISIDNRFLTETMADGLIISTPTGSTAYSISAGGPIIHPCVSTILLTPICPASLSFRPLVLPESSTIQLQISENSRGSAEVVLDGRATCILNKGEYMEIGRGDSIWCVSRGEEWADDLRGLLKFNMGFVERGTRSGWE